MAGSATAVAGAWVESLSPDTWFLVGAVPGKATTVQPVLSRLCGERRFGLVRMARGLYWRGYPEDHELHLCGPFNLDRGALLYAGAGAGLAKWNALNRLGWTLQRDPKASVSVCGRRLAPFDKAVRYFTHKNIRRRQLNWAEVTVLEALALIDYTEEPWTDCLEAVRSGESERRLKWDAPIRPGALLWAGETENGNTADLHYLLADVAAALPDAA